MGKYSPPSFNFFYIVFVASVGLKKKKSTAMCVITFPLQGKGKEPFLKRQVHHQSNAQRMKENIEEYDRKVG